jgi:ATP-dependent DNA ligase
MFNPSETGGLLIRAEVFDILFINGHNVQGETLEERLYRQQLSEILWKS